MKDFLHRTITEESTELGLSVTRTKTSNGFCSITIIGNGTKIQFTNEKDELYEQKVRELAKMIAKIADNPCSLPENQEQK